MDMIGPFKTCWIQPEFNDWGDGEYWAANFSGCTPDTAVTLSPIEDEEEQEQAHDSSSSKKNSAAADSSSSSSSTHHAHVHHMVMTVITPATETSDGLMALKCDGKKCNLVDHSSDVVIPRQSVTAAKNFNIVKNAKAGLILWICGIFNSFDI